MELKYKLKELRTACNMTQETVAEHLGVSSQTVSKWERGLFFPDITLLPKIALLFKCSIDSLFDMELAWGIEHRQDFEAKIYELNLKNDSEGGYQAWIREIELNPEYYPNYVGVMLHVYRKKMFDKDHIKKLISFAEHAEKCCTNDDIRNEIYRVMLQICFESDDQKIKEIGKYYYKKLPLLSHSREVYAKYVMNGEEYYDQVRKNIIHFIDLAECAVRQLALPDMPLEEKLFYYQKASSLYECVLDGKYAGFYDTPLLYNYYKIATIYVKLGESKKADDYIHRVFNALERHMIESEKENKSKLLYSTVLPGGVPTEQICRKILQNMMGIPELAQFKEEIADIQKRYNKYFFNE